jgi:serine/threonine-protein kinase RsbW
VTGERFHIELSSSPRLLQVVRAVVGQCGHLLHLEAEETHRLKAAVDEACANIIRHSYGGDPTQRIAITFTLSETRLEIVLRDHGRKPDPARLHPKPPDTRHPGGLGLPLIRSVMDEVEYDLDQPEGTALRLVKYLRRGAGKPAGSGARGTHGRGHKE